MCARPVPLSTRTLRAGRVCERRAKECAVGGGGAKGDRWGESDGAVESDRYRSDGRGEKKGRSRQGVRGPGVSDARFPDAGLEPLRDQSL